MTDEQSGLPADTLKADGTRSVQTSTTNIGAYMWSALVAERLGIIGHRETVERLRTTLTTLEGMERHEPSGQFYNWYDHRTGEKLTVWPPTGAPITPILSSVDNGWLAAGLRVTARSVPEVRARAQDAVRLDGLRLLLPARGQPDPVPLRARHGRGSLLLRHDRLGEPDRQLHRDREGRDPAARSTTARGARSPTRASSGSETRPVGFTRTYFGQQVYDGAYPYNGTLVTPGWGGSMFEALMPSLFVPEEDWGPGSWGANHPLTVRAQIHHGMVEAGYGYWGFSPANVPEGGYTVYGVDAIGMDPNGYPSNNDKTLVDHGFAGCPGREPQPDPPP